MSSLEKISLKALGSLLILLSLSGICLLILKPDYFVKKTQSTPSDTAAPSKNTLNKIEKIWREDLKNMKASKLFPAEWQSLKQVRVFMLEKKLHSFYEGMKSPIKKNPKGLHRLEVSFMTHYSEQEEQHKLIIQYNIINLVDENMIWELSRTVSLGKFFSKS